MKNFFRNHYGFICGFVSGAGFILFGVEAFKSSKNPLFYIGSIGLVTGGRLVYAALKKGSANSLNSTNANAAR
jgi:hypothetical protein